MLQNSKMRGRQNFAACPTKQVIGDTTPCNELTKAASWKSDYSCDPPTYFSGGRTSAPKKIWMHPKQRVLQHNRGLSGHRANIANWSLMTQSECRAFMPAPADPQRAGLAIEFRTKTLFALDENRLTVLSTNILGRVGGSNGDCHRASRLRIDIYCLSIGGMQPQCAIGDGKYNRWKRVRVRLVGRASFPTRGDHTEVLVLKNELIDAWIGLVRGRRILRDGGRRRHVQKRHCAKSERNRTIYGDLLLVVAGSAPRVQQVPRDGRAEC